MLPYVFDWLGRSLIEKQPMLLACFVFLNEIFCYTFAIHYNYILSGITRCALCYIYLM